jgi:hypothetical protein
MSKEDCTAGELGEAGVVASLAFALSARQRHWTILKILAINVMYPLARFFWKELWLLRTEAEKLSILQ